MTRHETAPERPQLRVVNDVSAEPRAPAPRPHALFPRASGSEPENRDIRFVGIQRKLAPADAKKAGHKIEHSPRDFPADELPDWAAVFDLFGGGAYKVCAKDGHGCILCWAPGGDRAWYVMSGRSKPLAEEDEEEAPIPPSAPAPAAPPAPDMSALMLAFAKTNSDAVDRLMQMAQNFMDRQMQMSEQVTTRLIALLNRPDPRSATGPPADLLEGVKLGADIARAAQAASPPAPPVDHFEYMRGTIALLKDVQTLTPTASGSSDMAQMGTMITNVVTNLKAGSARQEAATPAPTPQPEMFLIAGRWLTQKAAIEEYSRLMAGLPPFAPVTSAPAAHLAPATFDPALVASPLVAAAAPTIPPASSPAAPPPAVTEEPTFRAALEILIERARRSAGMPPTDAAPVAPAPLFAAPAPSLLTAVQLPAARVGAPPADSAATSPG